MRTVQLLLLCLLVCQTTESLTDKLVNLGANVTLDCPIDVKDIYWVFQKLTDSPLLILRTFTTQSKTDKRLRNKYSSLTFSRLFIMNVTMNELGIYYCVKPDKTLQISNGTRLYITEVSQDDSSNTTLPITESLRSHNPPQDQIPIIILSLLTVALFAAVIGLLMMNHKLSKEIPKYANFHQISTMKFGESNRGKTDTVYLEVLPNI
ncbi:uncharacterized protein LOC113083700 isoform X1 [Carassius auratus]|uniref:Uncharacterized protein LOC113083700 isoform X1 n=1 Tax=Carassius auratus TaxID=7957 RepID=A0A6P6NPF1_CARAU|nr:uncharacterized protein LOC113083700 isoform X1 [Carassius auratus]